MRTRSRVAPQPTTLTAGPFKGMRDSTAFTVADPTLALDVQNMVRLPGPAGGGLTGRPGFDQMGTQQGTGSTRVTGGGTTWTKSDGTRQTVIVTNGQLATYTWATDTWAVVVTTANLTTASCTLSASAKVALISFADGLVVSDGVNVPFWWDGTTGAGGITKMTNCPVLYGPPTVYYSKLVGIKASDRRTMVWSEEGEPNLGYEAGGYNNAWDNPGGYADPLTSVAGTNEALYVFRERIGIAITGAIGPDFATAGTRANLSDQVGTLSPLATIVIPQGVVIVDVNAQPWLTQYGQPPQPMWMDCRETVLNTPRIALGNVQSLIDEATRSLLIGIPEINQTNPSKVLVFSLDDLQFIGTMAWSEDLDVMFAVTDGDGVKRWAHAGSNDGYLYAHGTLEDGPWSDDLASGTTYIAHAVQTPALGYDLDRELMFQLLEAAMTGDGLTSVAVGYETPRGQSTPLTVDVSVAGVGMTWDADDWDAANWVALSLESPIKAGLFARGRWIRLRITHSELDESFGLTELRIRACAVDGNPRVP